jgi:prophage tail gpP-like protein
MPDVKLTVNGADYAGWKSVSIARGIEQIAGTFELGVSELWPGQKIVRNIAPGDLCTVSVDGQVVITGFVDDVDIRHDKETHEVRVAGRDATGDLVDCSAIHKSGKWAMAKMESIATDLCSPFGISVSVSAEVNTGAAVEWNINEGESAFECLDRLAKSKGVLPISNGRGGLVITRAGKAGRVSTSLQLGVNILGGNLKLSFRERFGRYIVKGQGASSDALFADATRLKAEAVDPMIGRYRPLVVIADDLADGATVQRRALWEANTRTGKSAQPNIRTQGWSHLGGLWQPNTLVHVVDKWMRTDADLLIKSVSFGLDESGAITTLGLTLPQAFDLIPMTKKKADPWTMLGKQQQEIENLKREQARAAAK